MTRDEWITAFCEKLGVQAPSPDEVETILNMAGTAAHASERTAAPVATWLAGRTGRPVDEIAEIAESVAG